MPRHDESGRAGAVARHFAPRNHRTSEAAVAAPAASDSAKKVFCERGRKKREGGLVPLREEKKEMGETVEI